MPGEADLQEENCPAKLTLDKLLGSNFVVFLQNKVS